MAATKTWRIVGGESVLMRWDAGEWTVQPYSVFSVPTTPVVASPW